MPKSYNSTQRSAIQQFTSFTNASDRTATKYLKANSWNVEIACDSYFHTNGRQGGGTTSSYAGGGANKTSINKIFDQYRQPTDPQDQMGTGGVMEYFQALNVSLEDSIVIALSEKLKSPTMGEFTRTGFVDGWADLGCDNLKSMKEKIPALQQSMAHDPDYFKTVYLWTFNWARSEGQKSLPLETAIEYWKLLLQGKFRGHLDLWIQFLTEKWNKSVPKDTWNMLYDFVLSTENDQHLDNYDELGAWPSVIDEYVGFYKQTRNQ